MQHTPLTDMLWAYVQHAYCVGGECVAVLETMLVVLQNIHSATEEFRLAQIKEREEFIKVSTTTWTVLTRNKDLSVSAALTPCLHTVCTHTDCSRAALLDCPSPPLPGACR